MAKPKTKVKEAEKAKPTVSIDAVQLDILCDRLDQLSEVIEEAAKHRDDNVDEIMTASDERVAALTNLTVALDHFNHTWSKENVEMLIKNLGFIGYNIRCYNEAQKK